MRQTLDESSALRIKKLEIQLSQTKENCLGLECNSGSNLLNLVVAKLLNYEDVKRYMSH